MDEQSSSQLSELTRQVHASLEEALSGHVGQALTSEARRAMETRARTVLAKEYPGYEPEFSWNDSLGIMQVRMSKKA